MNSKLTLMVAVIAAAGGTAMAEVRNGATPASKQGAVREVRVVPGARGQTYFVADGPNTSLPAEDPRVKKVRDDMQAQVEELKRQLQDELNKRNAAFELQIEGRQAKDLVLPERLDPRLTISPDVLALVGEVRREKGTYMGMNASPTDAVVRSQLKLPRGVGMTVDFVQKDSPASTAGLALHDVVTKIDDQYLVNLQQLQVLIRMHKAGDVVKVTFVRGGETRTVDVKLAEGMVPVMEDATPVAAGVRVPLPGAGANVLIPRADIGGGPDWQPAGKVTVRTENGITTKTMSDAEQSLSLQVDRAGKKTLSVEDTKKNEVVFSGPVDTDEDRKKLPAGVAEKLKTLESDRGQIRLQLGPAGGGGVGGRVVNNGVTVRNGVTTISRADGEHTLTLTVERDGSRRLEAKDKEGKLVFDGPVNTEEEKKKLPEDVARKLDGIKLTR